jgi:AraC-like DNA-binding protein
MPETPQLIEAATGLARPTDYFRGLDWGDEILPREIVAFCRREQDHRTSGWDGISARAGRYDQHSRYVLLVALEGSGSMGVETESRRINEGEAHLLFPHQVHYYIDLPEKFTWLYVTFDLEGSARQVLELWRSGGRQLSSEGRQKLATFLERFREGKGLEASIALGRVFEAMETADSAQNQVAPDADLVARVKKYVMENLDGDLAMPALSRQMEVSESYLRAIFREGAGVSLGNFVRSVRLVQATYLLEEDQFDLGAIAEKTGFGSLTSFTRAFRRMYEMTPSSYRKRARIEAQTPVKSIS